eukprot:4797779-Amphidinium_carterae.1
MLNICWDMLNVSFLKTGPYDPAEDLQRKNQKCRSHRRSNEKRNGIGSPDIKRIWHLQEKKLPQRAPM